MNSMDGQPDIGRRGLLTGAFLTREGREGIVLRQKPMGPLPPPWRGSAPDLCGSCEQQCISACPQAVIKLHPADHVLSGSPYLEFANAGCTFCGECADACPSESAQVNGNEAIGKVHVDHQKCLAWNNVFCMSCIGKCDFSAIQMDERRRLISREADCSGCGMCVHVCPVNALEVQAA